MATTKVKASKKISKPEKKVAKPKKPAKRAAQKGILDSFSCLLKTTSQKDRKNQKELWTQREKRRKEKLYSF